MKKRILSIVLTLCMVLMLVPTTAFAEGITPATPQTDTDGVYQIGTAEELYGFAQLVNNGNTSASAVLTADIIVNKGVLKADGNLADDTSGFTSWTPIGNSYSNKYTGKFDGQGHTISGLYFNDAATDYVGLFGCLESGEIKNVGVIDSYFNGTYWVGGVCGRNRGTITGCYNTGTVSGTGNQVGGVCGANDYDTITGCYNTGTVSGRDEVGGVCGLNYDGKITGCYSIGTVSGGDESVYVGGVCGYNHSGTVTDCDVKSDAEFKNGTVCGLLNTALKNENSDVRFKQGANLPELFVSVGGVYQISSAEELYGFAQLVNNGNTSASAVLTADITVNSNLLNSLNEDGTVKDGATVTSWTPIGNTSNPYTGSFDGQGHTVSGLYFNDSNTSFVGLFGNLGSSGEIKNVGVIDSYFNGYFSVGGVCGKNTGIITSCYNTGEVSGKESVGGVCGESFGTITGCYNTGEVSGKDSVGGVCGRNVGGTITGCYNTGTVSGSNNNVGGVCAYNTDAGYDTIGTITGSYNTGEVSGVESVGGVCGYEYKRCKIIGSYNTGTVSGVKYIGGVCGYEDNRCTIIGSYNTGTVSGTGNYVGGVCGFNFVSCIITGCYTNNGGVYGENNNGTVTDCDVMSDDEFADATVCKLLNTVLQNASSDVRFCQRIGKDASPLLTYQFESIDEHTYGVYTVDNNTFKATCLCGEKDTKTMELTLTTEKNVVANGEENTLTATLSNYDNESVTYKWYQNDALIENATTNTYKMPTNLSLGTYTYKVDVTMEGAGTITKSVSVFVDNDPPTGEISVGTKSWTESPDNITFDSFFKDTQTVTITASDNSGKPVTIEYLVSHKELTAEELANATFTAYSDTFNIDPDNEYVIYARLTDESGNVAYISSNGIVLDSVVPVISGIENGKTYCEEQTFTVTEDYIKSVTVNGTEVSLDANNQFTLNPAEGTQTIVVTDKAGNETSLTVTVNDGHTAGDDDGDCSTPVYCIYHPDTVVIAAKSHDFSGEWNKDKDGHWHTCQNAGCTVPETKAHHSGGSATCIDKAECVYCGEEYGGLDSSNHTGGTEIRDAKDATCTEEGYTGDTYCIGCGEKISTGTAIKMSAHNLEKIPAKDATVTATGNKEYWHCKDCKKYFSDAAGTNEITLDDTVISKLPPEIIEGKGQSITAGENKELSFTSNAAFSDFIRAQLDGKTLDEKYYTVKEGSTIVTLKADYVATLSAGEYTIGIVSESGTATTTFTVNAKTVVDDDTKSPQTGDNSNMLLWVALLFVSGAGVLGTTVYSKKKRVR